MSIIPGSVILGAGVFGFTIHDGIRTVDARDRTFRSKHYGLIPVEQHRAFLSTCAIGYFQDWVKQCPIPVLELKIGFGDDCNTYSSENELNINVGYRFGFGVTCFEGHDYGTFFEFEKYDSIHELLPALKFMTDEIEADWSKEIGDAQKYLMENIEEHKGDADFLLVNNLKKVLKVLDKAASFTWPKKDVVVDLLPNELDKAESLARTQKGTVVDLQQVKEKVLKDMKRDGKRYECITYPSYKYVNSDTEGKDILFEYNVVGINILRNCKNKIVVTATTKWEDEKLRIERWVKKIIVFENTANEFEKTFISILRDEDNISDDSHADESAPKKPKKHRYYGEPGNDYSSDEPDSE